jgi:preprotein translocase subunit SecY
VIRLLVTLLAPIIVWAAGFVLLPGVSDLAHLLRGQRPDQLSVVALGLTPALSAFFLVEIVVAAVPRWRPLRTRGPIERARLRRAALILTLVLSAVQAYFISQWLNGNMSQFSRYGMGGDPISPLLVTTTLVGGVCFVLAVAWLVDRWGLTSGFSVLMAVPAAAEVMWSLAKLRPDENLRPFDLVMVGTIFVGLIGATVLIFRKPAKLRLPVCGLVPLPVAHGFLFAAAWAGNYLHWFSVPAAGTPAYAGWFVALAALQAYAFSRRFARPAVRLGVTGTGAELRASIFYVLFMAFPWLMLLNLPLAIDGFAVATGVAFLLDIGAEWRARRKEPTLVDVWPVHDVATLVPSLAALEKAGIFAHARAVHHRSLLQFFGPFVPIDIYVPKARAEEAQEILGELYEM